MSVTEQKEGFFLLGDMRLAWRRDEHGKTGVALYPARMEEQIRTAPIDGCFQLKLEGDDFPSGFSNGHTLRNSQSTEEMVCAGWTEERQEKETILTLKASGKKGLKARQKYRYREGTSAIEAWTEYENSGSGTIVLDMAASFSLEGLLVPGQEGAFRIHRMRSSWSCEGRMEEDTLEELQLEPSWSGYGVRVERFGQIGSMPVRKYFPFAAAENRQLGITWGVKLCCPSSWQIELYRRSQELCLSGGLADFDFGHWKKELKPGECFATPKAYLTACQGDREDAARRLLTMEKKGSFREKLPVIFNEFCTSWGKPSETAIEQELDALAGHDIDYFVIDAGWYSNERMDWEANMGDWVPNPVLFPGDIKEAADKIRKAGKEPGIWFEAEIVGKEAKAAGWAEHLLKRDQQVITVGNRRFWDMQDPWVWDYLNEKVTGMLKENQFSYVKIDYNDSIGIGCDGAESLGEGLRRQIAASQSFLRSVKEKVPGLKMEICSSGGHRLESSMMDIGDFLSFSDAHEEPEIPVIAANLQRAVLPEKNEIWAVLRKTDSEKRLEYSLVNTFLGVMCLSGDIFELSKEQWDIVDEGIAFYRKISPVIINGTSVICQHTGLSYRNLTGWQAVARYGREKTLVVFHRFKDDNTEYAIPVTGRYQNVETFGHHARIEYSQEEGLKICCEEEFSAAAVLLG